MSHLCYFMSSVVFFVFFFFISLGIAMSLSLLLVSKNSFMAKDVNCLSCNANEILYFIVSNLLWCFVFCLYIKIESCCVLKKKNQKIQHLHPHVLLFTQTQ